jgi:hypothetical protein
MPTDIAELLMHQRKARAEASATHSLCLVCAILCVIVLVLLFVSDDFAQAVTQAGFLELGRLPPAVVP